MLNLPIGALVAASNAACVAPKSLPSSAFFVHSPLLARYSRLSAFSMRMYMREDSPGRPDEKAASQLALPKVLGRVAYPVEPFRFKFVQNDLSPPIPAGICERSGKRPGPLEQMEDCQANALQCSHRVVFICCSTGVTSEFWNEINQTPLLSSELRRSSTRWSAATRRWTQRSAGRRE